MEDEDISIPVGQQQSRSSKVIDHSLNLRDEIEVYTTTVSANRLGNQPSKHYADVQYVDERHRQKVVWSR